MKGLLRSRGFGHRSLVVRVRRDGCLRETSGNDLTVKERGDRRLDIAIFSWGGG